MVSRGKVRVNARIVKKPAQAVGPGDTLTLAQGRGIRLVRITSIPIRRGPAEEASACYKDLDDPGDVKVP